MASHEWTFEDIINVEELDDQSNIISSGHVPSDDPSQCPFVGSLPEPNGPLATTSPAPSTITDHNTSPELMYGYDLSSGFLGEPSALMLPPSSYDLYQPPWSPLNIGHGTGAACPRTTPDSLLNSTTMRFDTSVTHPSAYRYPLEVYRPSSEADTSLSYSSSEPGVPVSSASESLVPDMSLGLWRSGPTELSYTSSGPWNHTAGGIQTAIDPFSSSLSLPSATPPSPWSRPSLFPLQTSSDLLNYRSQRTEDLTNSESCVSPAQTVNSHSAPSPASLPHGGEAWWPLQDLLLSEQSRPSSCAQLPVPNITPENELQESRVEELPLTPGSDGVDGYHLLFQHAHNKWGDVGARDQDARDAALLEMRDWGLSYKDIKRIGNFPDALPTLRGRHRILTTPSTERVRRPPWQPRDEQLLRDAVRAQLSKPRVRRTQRIIWKEVADYVNRHGSSYKFSYVTCSQKWQQITANSHGFGNLGARSIRGRGAFQR